MALLGMVADKMLLGNLLILGFSMTDDNLYKVVDSVRKVLLVPNPLQTSANQGGRKVCVYAPRTSLQYGVVEDCVLGKGKTSRLGVSIKSGLCKVSSCGCVYWC